MTKSKIAALLGAACVAVLGSASGVAHAGQQPTCTVQYVAYTNDELIIKCSEASNEIVAWGPAWTACSTRQTSDTLKAFNSIAEAAFLSGKKLLINYATDTTCADPAHTSISYLRAF